MGGGKAFYRPALGSLSGPAPGAFCWVRGPAGEGVMPLAPPPGCPGVGFWLCHSLPVGPQKSANLSEPLPPYHDKIVLFRNMVRVKRDEVQTGLTAGLSAQEIRLH